ncbi:MAG: DEAD/DEAH box helicase [Verrucomicrobia bacterium]|nr:DEAD/DEAH box helicase [Verrucomicrobiota bacterium]MCH8510466.1 DEAD/DEAH box helicase [Kiritimatiellia bacterium]
MNKSAASSKTTSKTSKSKKAKKLPPLPPIMNDAECVESRRRTALEELAEVRVIEKVDQFRGVYEVSSTQWDTGYTVEIRDLEGRGLNSCSCMDFQMNRLGTCKHIERVFQFITHRRTGLFKRQVGQPSLKEEIFVDVTGETPRMRWLRSLKISPKIMQTQEPFFDAEGFALASVAESLPAVRAAVEELSPALRAKVRLSAHMDVWAEREIRRSDLARLRRGFEADVAAGKRGDNPVNLPLYPYQKEGMMHLAFNGRALLADEMGLGKTVQAIAAAELLRDLGRVKRVMVVSPASLKGEWEDQLAMFTGRKAQLVFGPRDDRLKLYRGDHPYLLCNYEQIRGDVEDINRLFAPDLVVLDEAQRIKNWPTKTAKTIKRLQSPFAFVLTGTPLENRVEELYSLVEFVDPHVFGTLDRFHREFMLWDEDKKCMKPGDLPGMHRRVSPVMLRRRKAEVETDLPDRTEKTFYVEMTAEQRMRYEDLEAQVAKLLNILKTRRLRKEELEKMQRLLACMRMICDTPYILDADCRDCPKLEELKDILDELFQEPDNKVIIFSEWVRMLNLVMELLDAEGVGYTEHHGTIPQQKRRENIRRFKKDPECRVFLSSESGGVGLNLQNANVVINLDLPWNPAKLEQRIARAWRKQQTRSVQVIHLVTENSIEESMLGKLAYKTALADSVLDGKAFDASMKTESGREAFLKRIRDLVGDGEARESAPRPSSKAKVASELLGRHGDRIQGIERDAKTGATVVVARPDSDLRALEDRAGRVAEGPSVVINTETLAAIRKLQEMGLLTLSADLESLHAGEGYPGLQSKPSAPLRPVRFPEKAVEHWQAGEAERKAAEALLPLGLWEPAISHVRQVLERGIASLRLYYTGETSEDPKEMEPAHRNLYRQLSEQLDAEPFTEDLCKRAMVCAKDLGSIWKLKGTNGK